MNEQLAFTIIFAIGFILLLVLNEFIYKRYHINAEYSRKFAHIFASLSSLAFLATIQSHWYLLFLGALFFLILYIGKRYHKLKSIDSVQRKTAGSYLLPIAIYTVFFIAEKSNSELFFILPILILGISDPLAGIFGTYFRTKTKQIKLAGRPIDKTILGSSIFFSATLLISLITLSFFEYPFGKLLAISITIAFIDTFVEMVSVRGYDNLTVPLTTILLLFLMGL